MTRTARVRALAKINLGLKVLHKRPDGFHELRTVFQTISLADTLEIAFTPARRTSIKLASNAAISGENLAERAARLALEAGRASGEARIRLTKRIPIGAGLGGGSSDAAAVLLALPVLAGRRIDPARLLQAAAALGSDVPFFLLGGTAVAVGRGTELYPMPDAPRCFGLLAAPGIHVSTAEAYAKLGRSELTSDSALNRIVSFESAVWNLPAAGADGFAAENDFETVVFRDHPQLQRLKRELARQGARPAMMSGSGSAVFGLFESRDAAARAAAPGGAWKAVRFTLVGRSRYHAMWWKALAEHIRERTWPPLTRYAS